jgi:hypothetical protein
MSKIIINSVDLTELKAKFDAFAKEKYEVQKKIKQGAAEFIAVQMKVAEEILKELLDNYDDLTYDEKLQKSQAAEKILLDIKFVSELSGVQFSLPYYNRQSDYYPDGTPYSEKIDEIDCDILCDLCSVLEDMEYEVSEWNTSWC